MIEGWSTGHTEALLVGAAAGISGVALGRGRAVVDPAARVALVAAGGLVLLDRAPLAVLVGTLVVVASTGRDVRPLVAALGIVLVGVSLGPDAPVGLRVLVPVVALVVAASVAAGAGEPAAARARGPSGFATHAAAPWFAGSAIAVTALAAFAAVPDTEAIVLVAAAAVVVALAPIAAPAAIGPATGAGALALVALVVWAAGAGARPRPAAFAGATAAWAVLLLVGPWARGLLRPRRRVPAVAIVVLHAGVALACARLIGLRDDVAQSWILAAGVLVALAGAGAAVGVDPPRRAPGRRAADSRG